MSRLIFPISRPTACSGLRPLRFDSDVTVVRQGGISSFDEILTEYPSDSGWILLRWRGLCSKELVWLCRQSQTLPCSHVGHLIKFELPRKAWNYCSCKN